MFLGSKAVLEGIGLNTTVKWYRNISLLQNSLDAVLGNLLTCFTSQGTICFYL